MRRARGRGRYTIALGALLAWMLLAWCPSVLALNPALDINQYAHTAWRIREGFSKGRIISIAQTPDGYLWLGTDLGVLRFDGARPVPWQPPADQPLPSNLIFRLLAARDGTLWIGTDKGLASWNGNRLTQYPEVAGQFIFDLLEDRDGAVWVGTSSLPNGKLCVIHNGSVQCYGEDGSIGRTVLGLYEDKRGNLWVEGQSGLWRWKPGPPEFLPLPPESLRANNLAEDADGTLLVGTGDGIKRLVDGKLQAYASQASLRQFKANRLLRDRDGSLWVGTVREGLAHIHEGRLDLFSSSHGLSGDEISALFEDREGNIWVSTPDGLDRFHELAVPTLPLNLGGTALSGYSVLAARDGSVLVAAFNGVYRWKDGQFTTYIKNTAQASQRPNVPYSLFQDARGRIWGITNREVGYLENGRFIPISGIPGGVARSIAEDTEGDLWIANQNLGLFQLRGGELVQQIPWDKLGHRDFAAALATDPLRGGVWLGFFQGGVTYFKDGQVRATYGPADGLGDGLVNDFRLDPDGTVWIAAAGGLSRLKNNRIATLTSRNGLPCGAVQWLREDDHSFWLYTVCGLVRIARTELDAWAAAVDDGGDTQRTIQTTLLDISDGVKSRAYPSGFSPQVARTTDGRFWFASPDGVSVLDPRHLPFNNLPPPVRIEQITADHKTYDAAPNADGQVRLPPLVRDLEIAYTALSLVAPEKVIFRYKLEGWDRDWQDAGDRRQAFYTNLPPRNYRFRVMACNNSGVWSEDDTLLDFAIAPAYYQTTWFRVLCVAAFLAMLVALYQLRLRQVAQRFNIRMEERVNERTRIARDFHDTLLQSFQGVLMKFSAVTFLLPHRADEAQKILESAIEQGRQAIDEGRDTVRGLRSSTVVTNELASALNTLAEELAADQTSQNGIDFHMIVEGQSRGLVPIVRDEVYRIASEALRNAFRHAQAGRIELEIYYDRRQLHLRVLDDGKGIDQKVLADGGRDGHYGLAGMQERAKLVGGKLTVLSRRDSGTEIELTIPAAIAYAKSPDAHRSVPPGKGM